MTFVQIIDCKTDKLDDLNRLMDTWVEQTKGRRTATHSVVGKDRDKAKHLVEIVEFPSYEEAMRNSEMPETNRIFEEMVALCEAPPTFTNLDVVRDEQLNKATARRMFDEIATRGNLDAVGDVFARDYHDHDPFNEEDTVGADGMRREIEMWRSAFDFTFTIEDQLAEGDRVMTRWTWTARHQGEFMGIAPTGRQVKADGMTVYRFKDGRIAEGWWNYDIRGVLRQLGAGER
ncbi:ester cyclase [Streptomyces sp. XD-27]|uniref:ester cyclase n=1 Tax=Streptomyces sp. XD-27 TaxID=3062779 RepID=UPI0026F45010|nr:ester cyclase [Streptomyces sp. XD-27]WKX72268.1 ester cyclase [Streptomyces sp. XD-27]